MRYRFYYTLRNRYRQRAGFRYPLQKTSTSQPLHLKNTIAAPTAYNYMKNRHRFTFLNLSHTFEADIDWNFAGHGKLWTYNLNYFDYLLQPGMQREQGVKLMKMFIDAIEESRDGLEPFPIALRGINWVKFLTDHHIEDRLIDDSLLAQYDILMDNLEYHLLGNHLLENGFSLLFGAYYFGEKRLFEKAREILLAELSEQILPDGAHFELAPMYHQIMLFRVLDCYNLMKNNSVFEERRLLQQLEASAAIMLGWLENMTYHDGTVPHFNDTAQGIAPTSKQLFDYAGALQIETESLPLKESGYRKCVTERYAFVIDVGNIGPDYIPGHAHSDTFNFELHVDGRPLIVDSGISTYESNARRAYERSTQAHNTVVINERDQSEVWSSFRVAKRAKIVECIEETNRVKATHDGYADMGILHTREVVCHSDAIEMTDTIRSKHKMPSKAYAMFHFAPGLQPRLEEANRVVTKNAIFSFEGLKSIEMVDITIAKEYNQLQAAKGLKVYFDRELKTSIEVVL